MSGSDFAPHLFSPEEKKTFETLLTQLRSFEKTVAKSFRQVEGRLDLIEENMKKNKDSLTGTKSSVTKLRNNLNEFKLKFEEKMGKLPQNKELEDFNELEDESINESDSSINETDETIRGNELENEEDNQEISVMDPFLGNGAFVGNFDGNPTVSFTKWVEKFKDILSLMTEPTEVQKLARLRFCLSGQARVAFDNINPAPTTLAEAIAYLKGRYENGNTKVIARQLLSNCRHAPGETVFEFANRLSETVRTALSGENEDTIKRRLLDEFLDRLVPELQFEVKAQRPEDYANAYEIAQHYELLLSARKVNNNNNISVANLADKVEALSLQNKTDRKETKKCYYCGKPGHFAKDCYSRKSEYNSRNFQPQNFGRSENRYANNSQSRRPDYRNYQENRQNRRENYQRNDRGYNRNRNYENYSSSRSRERENRTRNNNYNHRSPNRRVRFERNRSPRIGTVSPYMLVILAIFCFFGSAFSSPMICLKDAPISIWRLPNDPICPRFNIGEAPIPMDLSIYRANTLQYKTPAYVCKCVKTIVSKSRGFFGGYIQEYDSLNLNVPISECRRMRDLNQSRAGKLKHKNGTLRGTENNSDMDWKVWPLGIPWDTKETENCYIYETVVFTHHGMEGINTPVGSCPGCLYHSGTCKCEHGSLIWSPERTHKCSYIFIDRWPGEIASGVWLSESNEFAFSFENATKIIDCDKNELILTDQGFAIPAKEFNELVKIKDFFESKTPSKVKREVNEANTSLVYSWQLASQITALSASFTKTAKRIFADSVRQVCNDLQELADQIMTLAAANPTLLARHFLKIEHITARLVTERVLEIRPCYLIDEKQLHFNWKNGLCFDRLPVSFMLHGDLKHGFIDTNTKIIYPHSKEVECESVRYMYLTEEDRTYQFDQMTGDQKEISEEGIRSIARHGKLDIPEMSIAIFRNKILANLTELYSPEHFSETLETAAITHEIARLSNPNSIWTNSNIKKEMIAGNIVSNGLFSFLRGGILTANQLWIFVCCCFVTFQFLIQFVLPSILAGPINYLNIGEAVYNRIKSYRRKNKRMKRSRENENKSKSNENELVENNIPLSKRWPSLNKIGRGDKNKQNKIEICVVKNTQCDKNSRIMAKINGIKTLCLLDTGAHVSIISNENAKKIGLKDIFAANFPVVYGIGNKLVPTLGQATVELEVADCKIKTNFVIIKDTVTQNQSYSAIIGRETLNCLPLMLNFANWELTKIPLENKSIYCGELDQITKLIANIKINRSEKENRFAFSAQIRGIISKIELIDPQDKQKFTEFILKNEENFAKDDFDLGKCKITAPTILTNTEIPIQSRAFRTPEKYRTELKAQIQKMLENGIIEESNTPWVSNLVLVQKSDGKLRPCVDFRPLNKVTIADPYPLPRMDEVINKVAGKRWYSRLDLASGFWQIPLDRESSYKCGMITEWGLYEMKRLPFGLKNAPSIFQRVMDKILNGIDNVTAYIDDILVHTNDFEAHMKTLEIVLDRMKKNGFKLKGEKCEFLQNKCTYLGLELNKNGYQPAHSNCEVIKQFPEPRDIKEVKRFLGMTSFFRKFIPNFATLANPLNKLTRGRNPTFIWTEIEAKAFNELKDKLKESPCLQPPEK
uniref:RNA-directed DNA polymerase n=1 Tax=Meloidogyne enterolobii TaxID=390850 RepID=A0A6V7V042_MELEN|nr:unnamed protein product [Meloidogyne enterolobii]